MNRLEELYNSEVRPALKEKFGFTNDMQVPKLEKVTVNAGLGKSLNDSAYADAAIDILQRITGQVVQPTQARKSISNFKIREGMVVGAKVTLRGEAMYAFLDKLIHVAMPRVRDFQGLKRKAFDGRGNYSIGFKEHIVFPEIATDDIEKIVGLEVNIVTTAENDEQGEVLLEGLGIPFKKKKEQS